MSFGDQVKSWTAKTQRNMDAVFRAALQDVAHDASIPIAKGANMAVENGNLRNSLEGEVMNLPSSGSLDTIALQIARVHVGDTFYLGWSADYARVMNARYAFRDAAAQKWQKFIDEAVRRVQ